MPPPSQGDCNENVTPLRMEVTGLAQGSGAPAFASVGSTGSICQRSTEQGAQGVSWACWAPNLPLPMTPPVSISGAGATNGPRIGSGVYRGRP